MSVKKQTPTEVKDLPAKGPGRPKDIAKRDGIVRAATVLFMSEGYELTSMEAIAKKAGVSKLTIYSHFSDKVDLFKEVISHRCSKLATPECFLELAKQPVEQALIQLGTNLALLIFSPDSIRLQRIMMAEAAHHSKIVKIYYEEGPVRVRAAFSELLEAWNKRHELNVPDVTRATEQFFSLLKGEQLTKTQLLLASPPSEDEVRQHVQTTMDFFLTVYKKNYNPHKT